MGTEPQTQGSSGSPAGRFRKISKPLMEKKRRARINVSLEQLRSLLEKHYSHQIRKRKLEKADILELSVKYMKSLQNSVQGLWPVPSTAEYPSGFRGGRPGVSQLLRCGEEGGGVLRCPLVHECAVGSTMDSVSPSTGAPALRGPCAPVVWAPDPAAGGSRSPPPRLLLPRGLPGPSTSVQHRSRHLGTAPRPPSRGCACGDPGEAQAGLRTQRGLYLVCGLRDCFERLCDDGQDLKRPSCSRVGVAKRVPRARKCGDIHGDTVDLGLRV